LLTEVCDQHPHRLGIAGEVGRGRINAGWERHGFSRFVGRRNRCSMNELSCHRIAGPRNLRKQTFNRIAKKVFLNQYFSTAF
ncbi:hypothetical protein, partial [Bradyrhizobium sp.]|uniref:hypothetical protein n=1 Tax=Bradyrhizobium sp. TaxID=376 RepID=UPI003C32F8D5